MIIDQTNGKEYPTQGYTYSLHATPLSPSNTEGAVPNVSADLGPESDHLAIMRLYRKPIRLEEFNVSGEFHVSEPTDVDGLATIAGLSDLENLNVDLIWPINHRDFFGSVGHLIHTAKGVNPIAVDSFTWELMADYDIDWVMPGVVGNGWLLLKQFLSAMGLTFFEYDWWTPINAIKHNTLYDSYDLDKANIISSTVTLNTTDPADKVTVRRYEYSDYLSTFTEATPRFEIGSNSIISVEAGETVTAQVETSFSMSQLQTNKPRCLDLILDTIEYYTSVYTVTGNDDLPIPAKQWEDFGGDLSVEINKDDPTVLDVTVRGANLDALAPFRIGMSSGGGRDHSSLHVYARGVQVKSFPYSVPTGVVRPVQSEEEIEVDNPFLCRRETFPNAMFRAAREAAGFGWTLEFTLPPHQGVMKINDRVKHKGHWWRIDNVTVSQDQVSYVSTEATEIGHLNEAYEGMTIADFNAKFEGADMVEFAAVMLGE